jgi:heme iron utilization protein
MSDHDLSPVRDLLQTQRSTVLATQGEHGPYTSLMVFLPLDDLSALLLATPRKTAKYVNMVNRPDVALLVDDRSNSGLDVLLARALTVLGRAEEVVGDERKELGRLFAGHRPELTEFLGHPDTALIRVRVARYILIERFQEAKVFEMKSEDGSPDQVRG